MKVILDIKESKVPFVMELLQSLHFVKVQPFPSEKKNQKQAIREGIEELNLIKEGKLKGIPARELINEL